MESKQNKTTKKDYKLGRRIQKIRQERGITQEVLAEMIHTSWTWIAHIETGRETPNLKMLQKIARALGVKVKELIPY